VVDVVDVEVLADSDEALWLLAWVTVTVSVTVGVVVWASAGLGGLAGANRDFAAAATPPIRRTMLRVRPALKRFLRVVLRMSSEGTGRLAFSFWSSLASVAMART